MPWLAIFVQLIRHASVWYVQNLSLFLFFLTIKKVLTMSEFFSYYTNQVCKTYSRAYIHCLVTKDAMGSQLLSYHNLYYMMKVAKSQTCVMKSIYLIQLKIFQIKLFFVCVCVQLSRDLHSSIVEGQFPQYFY